MPRSGGRSGGGGRSSGMSRPTASAPPARAPQQQQQRPMTTTAPGTRQQQQQAPAQTSGSPGLFGQMASTAAGVAVGSSIGHAIGGFFGGGGSSQEAAAPEQQYSSSTDAYASQPMDQGFYNTNASSQQSAASGPCAADTMKFTQCFEKTGGDMTACGYYLEQLKACQQAARQWS